MTRNANRFLVILILLLVVAEVVRFGWYASSSTARGGEAVLELTLPQEGTEGFERMALAETRGGKELAYDYGDLVRLFDDEKNRWSMDLYYLEYAAGNARQLKDLFDHSPEVCLRASGSTLERTLPHLERTVDGNTVLARHLVFSAPISNSDFHVFKLVWLSGMEELGIGGEDTDFRKVRLKAALGRHSRPPARLILISLSGAKDDEDARHLFEREVLRRCSFVAP